MTPEPLPDTVGLILHFRHDVHTAACLSSMAEEGVRRIVVVDNSEDGGASLQRLRPALEKLAAVGMEITLSEPERNLGFSAGVNLGLSVIRESFGPTCVLLINNDARLCPGAHARLREALGEGGLAVPRMVTATGETIDSLFYHRSTGLLFRRKWPGSSEYPSGCCMLLAPELIGGPLFDEDFFFYGEDTELGWRLARLDILRHRVPGAVVEHSPSTGSRNGSLFYEYHMVRAHWLLARKLADTRGRWLFYLSGRALLIPVRAILRCARHRSTAPIRGAMFASWDAARGRLRSLTPPGIR